MPEIYDPVVVGERLRVLRGDRTCQAIADELGVTRGVVSMYENGIRTPSDDMKLKIARLYGKTVAEIFFS